MKAPSTTVEGAFFVSSASKTSFSYAQGNEKSSSLPKEGLKSFHPLHVDFERIFNPERITFKKHSASKTSFS
jgi:hypothetical protein